METEISTFDLIARIGASLSVLCVIALFITWCLMPRWRTLHNYIGINQITFGTLHLLLTIFILRDYSVMEKIRSMYGGEYLFGSVWVAASVLFEAKFCWSLASALLAYFKLVLLHKGTVSYEKTSVTIFVFGLAGYIKLICQCIVRSMYSLDSDEALDLEMLPVFLIISLIIMIFIKIVVSVMSCFKNNVSKRNARHILALIGVAIVCDTGTMLWLFFIMFYDNNGMGIWFCFRLVPHTLFILFNSSSMEHWKWYMQKRKREAAIV